MKSTSARLLAPWIVVPLLFSGWAWRRLSRTWFFYDEWSMIRNVVRLSPWQSATTSFNGHLWFFQDAIYRVQGHLLGFDDNVFVIALFMLSLLTLHLVLAGLAVRLGAPVVPAVLLGGLLTYLGAASQNFIFAIQVSPTFATAAAFGVALVILDRVATTRRVVVAGGLVLLSALFDSGVGLLGMVFGGGVLLQSWPRRTWWALVPGASLLVAWYVWGDLGPQFRASLGERCAFAVRLLVRSAGAVVGGGYWPGIVVLVMSAAVVALCWRRGRMVGAHRAVFIAGVAGTAVTLLGITQSRAGLPGFTFRDYNRYLQNVGVPLVVAVLPSWIAAARELARRWPTPWLAALPPLLLVGAFSAGVDDERDYAATFVGYVTGVEQRVQSAMVVIRDECPSGRPPNPASSPTGPLSPQIDVALIAYLMEQGLLHPPVGVVADPDVVAVMCG